MTLMAAEWVDPGYRGRFIVKNGIFLLLCAVTAGTSAAAASNSTRDVEFHAHESGSMSELPFSESVRVDKLLFLSGQIGTRPGTTELVDGGIEAEARQTMENIHAALKRHGLGMGDLVKCTIMLADISEWSEFNDIYRRFFDDHFPARSAFGTSGLALDARVEVECIAAVPGGNE